MKKTCITIGLLFFLLTPGLVYAQTNHDAERLAFLQWNPGGTEPTDAPQDVNPFNTQLESTKEGLPTEYAATENTDFYAMIFRIIRIGLSFLGIGTISLILYAGARWMTSQGNDDQVREAKKTLRNAVIGLILISMAYSLSVFIARRLQRTTGSYGGQGVYLQIME